MKNLRKSQCIVVPRKNPSRILQRSSLYRELSKERDEIDKLKWLESEKTGQDIGVQKAIFMWVRAHRNSWRTARKRLKQKIRR